MNKTILEQRQKAQLYKINDPIINNIKRETSLFEKSSVFVIFDHYFFKISASQESWKEEETRLYIHIKYYLFSQLYNTLTDINIKHALPVMVIKYYINMLTQKTFQICLQIDRTGLRFGSFE